MRLAEKMKESGIDSAALAEAIHRDARLVDGFAEYESIPIPDDLAEICKVLNCGIDDLYEYAEVHVPYPRKKREEAPCYKVTVRLPPDAAEKIATALRVCGYMTISDWIRACYARLMAQYKIIKKAEAAATTPAKGKKRNQPQGSIPQDGGNVNGK